MPTSLSLSKTLLKELGVFLSTLSLTRLDTLSLSLVGQGAPTSLTPSAHACCRSTHLGIPSGAPLSPSSHQGYSIELLINHTKCPLRHSTFPKGALEPNLGATPDVHSRAPHPQLSYIPRALYFSHPTAKLCTHSSDRSPSYKPPIRNRTPINQNTTHHSPLLQLT